MGKTKINLLCQNTWAGFSDLLTSNQISKGLANHFYLSLMSYFVFHNVNLKQKQKRLEFNHPKGVKT